MDDPWFTYYRGRGRMQITPRNAKGWAALVAFVGVVTGPALLVSPHLDRNPWLFVPFFSGVALLTFVFIRLAIAKSERVDLDMSAKDLEEFRAWKRRGKR
ncbi:hypothetical protein [Sphingomonas glaciei]|uniref:Uncharacterized protein n=1 Tax=Sphingomonas glaciei TaxID=2938948 RepID=A0ABY5MRS1_9SPHN|nr:hypothetical protein [Sphingomonas glaciei]UUR07194.1 hypothetical protein M1K48_09580 [Sphingomonas glaciei]